MTTESNINRNGILLGGFFRNVKSHNSKMSSNVCFFAAGNILKVMNRACLTKNANTSGSATIQMIWFTSALMSASDCDNTS